MSSGTTAWVLPLLLVFAGAAAASQLDDAATDQPADPTFGSHTIATLFPAGDVYPVYVADPHRPSNTILFRFYLSKGIPATTSRRTSLSAGGRFGMLRIDTNGPEQRSWQISLDAGLDALFDTTYSDEVIGWDGNYGLTLTTKSEGPWSFKLAALHVSAHVGDEYEDRMNHKRIDYTREEIAFGVAWSPEREWRVYGETARSYHLESAEQAPWRLQGGIEYEGPPSVWGGRFAWYGAADVQSMQERDWRIDPALQGGLVTHSSGRTYRLTVEYYNGRPTATEFFNTTETSLTVGLRIDL